MIRKSAGSWRTKSRAWLFTLVLIAAPDDALAQTELVKLTPSDGAAGDEFGTNCEVNGNVAVIGAVQAQSGGHGSAYIFRFDGTTWVEEAKLTASDGAPYDAFGYNVSVRSDVAVISAIWDDDAGYSSGSAYVFRFDGTNWVEEAKLTATDAGSGDSFGWTVPMSGDVILVGSPGNDDAGLDSGSAYVFRFDGSGWIEEAKLTASDAAAGDLFGYYASLDGDVAVIGALGGDAGPESGSAYVFKFNGANWVEEAKLSASDGAPGDAFGRPITSQGNVIVLGAWEGGPGGSGTGSAYVFRFDGTTWVEEAKLTPSDGAPGDSFGIVSMDGDVLVSGASFGDGAVVDSGAAYVFRYDGNAWHETAKLIASDGAEGDRFGVGASLSGDYAVIPAHRHDGGGTDAGAAYVYRLVPLDTDADGLPDDVETNTGIFVSDSDTGTDPNDSDTDDDGLLDGTEVEMAMGTGCPDPLNADSDGDLISDGDEVNAGTNACSPDTDGDGVCDLIDSSPVDPDTSSGPIEDSIRVLADLIDGLALDLFKGPNENASSGRRNSMSSRVRNTANAVSNGSGSSAVALLTAVLEKVDGDDPDWMIDSVEREGLAACLAELIALLM